MRTQQDIAAQDKYTQGIGLYRQGRYAEAIDHLKAVATGSDLPSRVARYYHGMAHRQLGVAALRQGQYPQAERHLRTAMGSIGRQGDLLNYLAALYAKTGRYSQCAEQADRSTQGQPHSASAARSLALAQWQAGRRPEAYMTLTAAIRQFPGDAALSVQLGLFYASEEKFSEAAAALNQAAEKDCSSADARYYLGLVSAAAGDVQGAVRSFQRAMELRPNDLLLAYQLAMAARAAAAGGAGVVIRLPEKVAPAPAGESRARQLANFIAAEPDFIEAFLVLPPSEIDVELFELLAGAVKMALADRPNYADLHLYCGRVLARLGRLDEAIEHARHAVRINPRYVRALVELARLYARVDKPAEAIAPAEEAIRHGADWPDVHCLAGEMLCRCGRKAEGRDHLARALKLNAKYSRAAEALRTVAA